MSHAWLLLALTLGLLAVFGAIVARTYSPKRRADAERAKYRMLEDE